MSAHRHRLSAAGLRPTAAVPRLLLACLLASGSPAWAILHTTCVNNETDLHNELEKAGESGVNNDGDNHINLAVGTYATNNVVFQYASAKTFTLDITGGYNADCSKQITKNPIYTVLSGLSASKQIMVSNSMGDVSLRFLTFKGGKGATDGSALTMNTAGATGQVIIDYDIFTQNTGGADVVDIGGSSLVQIDSSLFHDNVSDQLVASVRNVAKFFALNNTFAQNAQTSGGLVAVLAVGPLDSTSTADLSNNIFVNARSPQVTVGSVGTMNLAFNQLPSHLSFGATVNEIGAQYDFSDVMFASTMDFHLQSTSPAIAVGTLTPPDNGQPGGALPTLDVQGNPRTYSGTVDLGAYERGDEIFEDGLGF